MPEMESTLREYIPQIEAAARGLGLDYYPVDFELVPPSFMMEVAVYGLPVRMPHWSFGVRWIYQMIQHRMGHSRIFEVVFPGRPNRAYLVDTNSLSENTLVVAHVLGHADFSHNNLLFVRSQREAGYHIVEQAAAHAHTIDEAIAAHGRQRVEAVLDAALALEQHIDAGRPIARGDYRPGDEARPRQAPAGPFRQRFEHLPGEEHALPEMPEQPEERHLPPRPEADLLWFIARYGPALEDWERDIFLAVREEAFYFLPVFNGQIMNEGWASFWHAQLLRELEFVPDELYIDAMKTHSDVVRPHAGERQVALSINPYHLGFEMWRLLTEQHGMEGARRIMSEEDDFGFIRNHLGMDLAHELKLFTYSRGRQGRIRVTEYDLDQLHEAILRPKYNFGAPRVTVDELRHDGTLVLRHDYRNDGRGLDPRRAQRVLEYVHKIWRRPVWLYTVGPNGEEQRLEVVH
jgi:stage V sporulation protein R